jgi:medium-chain acyl-[acyl-carrier-protein] hydrolase
LERHVFSVEDPLACPLSALGGTRDQAVPVAALEAWRAETTGGFSLRLFPGGHFFLQDARRQVIEAVVDGLRTGASNAEFHWLSA